MGKDMDENTVKAIEETAKATSKSIDTVNKFGSWIAPFIDGSLEQVCGILEDKLKYYRWSNKVDLMEKVDKKIKELGLEDKIKPLPFKIAIPLIEASSLEDDPFLKDLWVNLLVNSSSVDNNFTLERSYINVLEQLSSFEAQVLKAIYANKTYDNNTFQGYYLLTYDLPNNIIYEPEIGPLEHILHDKHYNHPTSEVKLALANLNRLQCIQLPTTRRGIEEEYSHIYPTLFGAKLVEAVS